MAIAKMRPLVRSCLAGNVSMSLTFSPGLRQAEFFTSRTSVSLRVTRRTLSSRTLVPHSPIQRLTSSQLSLLSATPTQTNPSSFFTPSLCRHASTSSATQTSDPTSTTAAGVSNPEPSSVVLDWNNFFTLRKSRRRYSLASSIVTSLLSCTGTALLLTSTPDLADQITKLIPTDPFVSMGLATVASLLLGWLIGPIFGNAVWRLLHRSRLPEFTIKERAFFERIKKHRVNPTGASTNNPVPDFYGEKVGSVTGYRRWLKDQRAFNRKREGIYNR